VRLPPSALTALVEGDLATASALTGVALPPFFLEEGWLWRLRLDQVGADPAAQAWVVRAVVVEDAGVVGHAGFHGPPDADGVVEVGYTVLPHLRGRGYAKAALAALIAEAAAVPEVRVVRACVQPGNAASLAVVRGAGFVEVGEVVDDEDGVEVVHELLVDDPGSVRQPQAPNS
jgi:RimJ/RimL family protein N-acetyltransferase